MAAKLSGEVLEELGFLTFFPDRRIERILFPPDDNIYPADLYGGTWKEGLQAIEDFDWSGPPEEPQTSQERAASESSATAAQVTVSQELSAAKVQGRTNKVIKSNNAIRHAKYTFAVAPPIHIVEMLTREGHGSGRSPTPDAPTALRNMPFGRTSSYMESEPSHGISSLQLESSINQSTKVAEHAVVGKAAPCSFLAGLQEAAAAASPSTDSEPTSLGTPMATGPTEVVSAGLPWADTLPSHLSLHRAPVGNVIPDVPMDDASASASNAPFTPKSQTSVLETVPIAESSVASLKLETSIPRKRAEPATINKSLDKRPAATLFKPDDSSESDDGGYSRKKRKTNTLTEARATTGGGNAKAGTPHGATATTKERATEPSKRFLNELEEDEINEREEVLAKLMKLAKPTIHGNGLPFTQQMSTTLPPASQSPKSLLFQGLLNSAASQSTPKNPAPSKLSAMSKERLDASGRIVQGMGQRDRHPLDLGYEKRRTRADAKQEEKRERESANSGIAKGVRALDVGEIEEMVVDAEEAPKPKTKRQGRSKAKTKPKPASFHTGAAGEMGSDSEDPLAPPTKAAIGFKKGKAAPTTNPTAAKPKTTRAKPPPKTGAPKAQAAPGTPSSNNSISNKYGFKPVSGPRKPRADNAKGKAQKPANDGTGPAQQPGAGKAERLTRRMSAAQEQVEKEAEKQKNIGLRLRSGDGKK